jgi:glyoxylase-like metal-dependent hydrolase (beta-lactamase superfamily II)
MRLRDRIHLVGSGSSGLYLTDAYDAHAFMVVGDREAVLIDAGCGRDTDALLRVVMQAGVDPSHVSRLLLTHAHADHSGGAAALRRRLPHLRVYASVQVAEWVERADEEAMSVDLGRRAEFYPPDYTVEACPVTDVLTDGQVLDLGGCTVAVLATPGHAAGHLAYVVDDGASRLLVSGDVIFWGGKVSLLATWDCDLQALLASLRRLDGLAVDALLPGHHNLALRDGQAHLDKANRLIAAGFVPPSIV